MRQRGVSGTRVGVKRGGSGVNRPDRGLGGLGGAPGAVGVALATAGVLAVK